MNRSNGRLVSHLEAGGTVLTANRRQARIIRRLHDRAQLAAGRRCWRTVEVLPLEAWLAARWQEAAGVDNSLPLLLTDSQASWPWRRLAGDFDVSTLVAMPDLAGTARRSLARLLRHGGSLESLERQYLTRDQRQFHAWAQRVEADLAAAGWLDPLQLETFLALRADLLEPGPPLLLAGFERPAPALLGLAERLAARGFEISFLRPEGETSDTRLHAAPDAAAETRAWLGWARRRLQDDPQVHLAVVVPDLQSRRHAIERGLEAFLQPELELPGACERDRLFDLAGGEPLARLGIVGAALDSLHCGGSRIDFERLAPVLRSRYLAPEDDPDDRAGFELRLREGGQPNWDPEELAALARKARCAALARSLESSRRLLQEGALRRPSDGWAQAFGKVLAAWKWPGTAPLGSDEFQAAAALRERLAEFAGLARVTSDMSLGEASTEFVRLAAEPFQPERGEPAIWVLDALDAPGVEFDGLWVSGLSAARWPGAARPDPFLPLTLQRQLGIPGATAEDAFAHAARITAHWRAAAAEVIFSWPIMEDDARVEPSRLLPLDLPVAGATDAEPTRADILLAARHIETVGEDPAPPLAGEAFGGARILDLQAKCPFRAFAELRLAARPIQEPAAGVERRTRGALLHKSLELIWLSLRRRSALLGMTAEALDALVDESLEAAMAACLPAGLGARARNLEREWQRESIFRLLELERGRDDFEVVALEAPLEQDLEGLQLRLRVDRIDRIGDGLVILDYKTGRAATSQWRGSRPDAPQLPLYVVSSPDSVAGVGFAVLGAHAACFKAVGSRAALLPGMLPAEKFPLTDDKESGFSWEQLCRRWATWLGALAAQHRRGEAAVDPKLPDTCRQCHLGALCRVAPGFEREAEESDLD